MVAHAAPPLVGPVARKARVLGFALVPPRRRDRHGRDPADARILRVLEVVARELEKPHSVKHLAAQLRLSPSRFEHLFKSQTGQGFKAFLREARLTRAAELLQDPTLQIKEVAAVIGYANVSNFTHDFTKYCGESPSRSRSSSPQGRAISLPPKAVTPPDSRFHQQIADFTNK